ncbi:MAG: 30S ribosomal protein S4, partial [Acidimicrobiia bacterium]|nr:30S ribosomal protein S4 [Acidimicrobiia bacterium]
SFQVREGDVVEMREKSKNLVAVQQALDVAEHPIPEWVDVEPDDRKITVRQLPSRDQIDTQIQEQLIVELYSK